MRIYRGFMAANVELAARMAELQLTRAELAERMNDAIERLTGRRGLVSDRTVRRYLSGESRRPQGRQRVALESVFGCTAEALGFDAQEDHVYRRTFIAATTGSALAVATASRPTVGRTDVHRLGSELARLVAVDDAKGGGASTEARAVALARRAMDLQQNGSATQRVRAHLYALAAAFTAAALWAAIDSRQLDRAQRHLETAVTLAGLSGDSEVQHQVWRYAATLADQRGRHADAVAASEAAMGTNVHRTDPLYASLSHARLALTLPWVSDRNRSLRALDRAAEAFSRADPTRRRPASMDFFTRGELDGLTSITYLRLGRPDEAEYHAHRCLGALRTDQHRNRAYYTAYAALAQLAQNEPEQACATAGAAMPPPGSANTGRVHHLIHTFTSDLNRRAPGAEITRTWNQLRSPA
ncbi:hypothetical protein [Streptomyces sp. NPDC059708]|uniref:hypothetical protein n=1 Tax=Streptomyces sp. NPDC059708 TaxID=3346916 RepID=UPI0036A8B359